MNFYISLIKTRKKFDKYIKVNRIRNKVIVDINELLDEYDIDLNKHKDYFNLIIYTKINHALKKNKDVYYIPNYKKNNINLDNLFKLKDTIIYDINFNILFFYDEFKNDEKIIEEVFNNLDKFTYSQIIKDY